jgi:hypothetical protein
MSQDTQPKTRKAKRKLSEFDFSSEDSHLALVGPSVGGPANERTTLIFKASNKFSDETILKMQQIQVTMELPEFLRRFFDVWDSDLLARLFGYVPPEDDDEEWDYESYLQEKLQSYTVIKSLKNSKDLLSSISELNEKDYLALLQDQEKIEKSLKESNLDTLKGVKKEGSTKGKTSVGANKSANADKPAVVLVKYSKNSNGGWEPTDYRKVDKEDNMSVKETVEMVEKSVVDSIQKSAQDAQVELQKALDAQKVELQKAQEMIQQFAKEKQEAIEKSRFAQIKDAVKDEAQAEVLFKAAKLLSDEEEFSAVVKALKGLQSLADKSDIFKEVGVDVEGEGTKVNPLERLIKSKYQNQSK